MIAREQEEQAVADGVQGERATFPDAQDVGIEDRAADVVQLEIALEARLGGERLRVDGLDRREVIAVRGQLGQDRLAAPITEQVVVLVEAERRGEHRVVVDEPDEPRFDEVVEAVVKGSAGRRRRGARERCRRSWVGHLGGTSGAPGTWRGCDRGGDGAGCDGRTCRRPQLRTGAVPDTAEGS